MMNQKNYIRLTLVFLMSLVLPVYAADAVEQLKNFTKQVKSAEGEFLQQQVSPRGGPEGKPKVTKQLSGKFIFLRPGKFLWETQKPFEQKLVADGKQLIMWDKDLNQATYRPANQALAATPAAILFGDSALEQYFNLTLVGDKGGFSWVELSPIAGKGGQEDIPYAKIGIGMLDNQPQAMELQDSFGNVVLLTLSKIKTNVPVPASRFQFNPPAGAEIVKLK